ncbi:unnamed protein product [Mesocestoides corti]|uniref:Ribos_L4_asso_C domain-containing protein n=1 Tax=Mesocestoides corti TaxID=53468 RepID=A0A0R3UNC5_MESCO|nr:unnamed protein product [Mesocestoides corti]
MGCLRKRRSVKKNPLKNMQVLIKLNPNARAERNARVTQNNSTVRRKHKKSKLSAKAKEASKTSDDAKA